MHDAKTIVRAVLFCVAAALWGLYFHEVLFRSGKVETRWVKKILTDVALMLLIALVTMLIFTFGDGLHIHRKH